MKRLATSRNAPSRKSAERTGLRAITTATASPRAASAKMTKATPAPPVRRTPPVIAGPPSTPRSSSLLHHREGLDVRSLLPVGELADVQVQGVVALVGSHLVGLRGQPDRLGHSRAGLFAQLAEHAALDIDVEPVENLDRLSGRVLLVVPVDVNDVDRALDGAQRALDAPLLVQPEHSAEAVRGNLLLLRILDGHLLAEEVTAGHGEAVEEIEQGQAVEPLLQRHRSLLTRIPGRRAAPRPGDRAGPGPGADAPEGTSPRTALRRSRPARRDRACFR